jgi:hypothetical protein
MKIMRECNNNQRCHHSQQIIKTWYKETSLIKTLSKFEHSKHYWLNTLNNIDATEPI